MIPILRFQFQEQRRLELSTFTDFLQSLGWEEVESEREREKQYIVLSLTPPTERTTKNHVLLPCHMIAEETKVAVWV